MIRVFICRTVTARHRLPAARAGLLAAGLCAFGLLQPGETFHEGMLAQTPAGKPFLKDHPDIHFSLSHSGDWIACAFSDAEVGLDLQENRLSHTDPLRIARRFFTPEEYCFLLACRAPVSTEQHPVSADQHGALSAFYALWTIKEAYLKYIGCGLHVEMDSFRPDPMPDPDLLCGQPDTISGINTISSVDTVFADAGEIVEIGMESAFLPGNISVLKHAYCLSPAEYAFLPAPSGYTMTVSAARLR